MKISSVLQNSPVSPLMLGRPAQALESLAKRLAVQVAHRLQHNGHRNIPLEISQPRLEPLARPALQRPKAAQVELTRATVQAYMAERYGFALERAITPPPPPSSTETRITDALVLVLRQTLQEWLPAAPQNTAATSPTSPATSTSGGLCWRWTATLRIAEHPAEPLCITLDAALSLRLEQAANQLRQQGHHHARPSREAPQAAPLHITVVARLLERQLTAAQLQDLRPGSVLPIALGKAMVLLNDNAMLTASVAEHQGKLHLTDFETLE